MRAIAFVIGLLVVAAATLAWADDYKLGTIAIAEPWARATPRGASVGAGYMKITNAGQVPDRLIAAATPIAGKVEIHEISLAGGVMRMRELATGLELKPGQTVDLTPGTYHVMFVGLRQPLQAGEHVTVTLVFEHAGKIDIPYTVQPIGGPARAEVPRDDDITAGHDRSGPARPGREMRPSASPRLSHDH